MIGQGHDASAHCFEIKDTLGRHLMDLPFSEAMGRFRPLTRAPPRSTAPLVNATATARASHGLAASIAREIEVALQTIEQTNRLLRRSRATSASAALGGCRRA